MAVRYDQTRKRIICRWEEPTRIVMDKKEGVIKRSRMITVKVNENGKLNSKDRRRHEKHPMFPYISRFNQLLNKMHYFPEAEDGYTCAVCGASEQVSPHFDPRTQSVVWLCGKHSAQSPEVDA